MGRHYHLTQGTPGGRVPTPQNQPILDFFSYETKYIQEHLYLPFLIKPKEIDMKQYTIKTYEKQPRGMVYKTRDEVRLTVQAPTKKAALAQIPFEYCQAHTRVYEIKDDLQSP